MTALLAAGDTANAGPIGLFIVLLLGAVTVLLIRNMNGRLRRLPPSFPDPPARPDPMAMPDPPATQPAAGEGDAQGS